MIKNNSKNLKTFDNSDQKLHENVLENFLNAILEIKGFNESLKHTIMEHIYQSSDENVVYFKKTKS